MTADLAATRTQPFGLWDPKKHPRNKGKFASIDAGGAEQIGHELHADATSRLTRNKIPHNGGSVKAEHHRDGTHTLTIDHGSTSHKVTIGHDSEGNLAAHIHQNKAEESGDLGAPEHAEHRAALQYGLRRQGFKLKGSSGSVQASATERFDMVMPNPPSNDIGDTALLDIDERNRPDENPTELAQAVDAVLDAIEQEFAGVDMLSLPPQIQQAIALVVAADTTVDKLLAVLQIPDPDEPTQPVSGLDPSADSDVDLPGASDLEDGEYATRLKAFATVRRLAADRLARQEYAVLGGNEQPVAVPGGLAPKTANPEVGGDPEKLAGQVASELDQLAAANPAGSSVQLDTARGIASQVTDSLSNGDSDGATDYASGLQDAIVQISGLEPEQQQTLTQVSGLVDQLVQALASHQQAAIADTSAPPVPLTGAKPKPFTAAERALYEAAAEVFSVEMFVDDRPGDGNKSNADSLRKWFNEGADGAIQWGKPGDFMQCVAVASKHMTPEQAKGFCNNRHEDTNGGQPAGVDAHGGKHAATGEQFADTSAKGRRKSAASGAALPDGSFPINGPGDIPKAVRALGRADESKRAKVKAHIKRRARSLGATGLVPDSWKASASRDHTGFFANPDQQESNRQAADAQRKAQAKAKAAQQAPPSGGFDESKHPRGGAGSPTGGQFVAEGSGSGGGDDQSQALGVQQALGLDPTGTISASDTAAIKQFQQENGLAADGLVGSQTADALREKVGGGDPKNAASEPVGALGEKDKDFLRGNDPVWSNHPAKGGSPNPFGGGMKADAGAPAAEAPATEAPAAIEATGRNFKIPVGIIEGVPTGDKRKIAPEALSWRQPPLPVMAITKTTEKHNEAELVGHVLELARDDASAMTDPKTGEAYGPGVFVISARGKFMNDEYADKVAGLIRDKFLNGVSADLSDVSSEFEADPSENFDEQGGSGEVDLIGMLTGQGSGNEMVTAGRIMGFTICPFPAFEGAYLEMDDGDGQITSEPVALSASAERWPAFEVHDEFGVRECEPCQQGLVASAGAGPMYPPKDWFSDPGLTKVTPLTITDDGRVFGHLAPWNQCHTGASGQCIIAPRSRMDYGLYHKGALKTADGDVISTGVITMDTGHASEQFSLQPALAHYDDTGSQVCDVCMGEDKHGIWFSGAVRPDVDELKLRRLRASGLSGDWRLHGGNLELMAALAVNVEGFPKARARVASGAIQALTAAGGREVIRYALADKPTEELEALADIEPAGEPSYTDRWVSRLVAERVDSLRASVVGPRLEALRASVVTPAMQQRAAELRGQVVRPKASELLQQLRVQSLRASMGLDPESNALVSSEYAFWDEKKHPRGHGGVWAPSVGDHVQVHSAGHGLHGVRGHVVRTEGDHTVIKDRNEEEHRVHTNRLRPVSMAAAGYNEKMHPRGHDGKWIHPGDTVQVKGGGEAKVVGIASDGDLRVKTTGGESLKIKPDTVSGGSNKTPIGGGGLLGEPGQKDADAKNADDALAKARGESPAAHSTALRDLPADGKTPVVHPQTGENTTARELRKSGMHPSTRVFPLGSGDKGPPMTPAQESAGFGPLAADVGAAGSDTHVQTDGGEAVHKADAAARMHGQGSAQHKAAAKKFGRGVLPTGDSKLDAGPIASKPAAPAGVEANGVTGPVGNLNPRPVLPAGWKPPTSGPSGPPVTHPHNLGDQVSHPTYGTGTVTGIDPGNPAGPRSIVQWDRPHPELGPTGRSSERPGDLSKTGDTSGDAPGAGPSTGGGDINAAGDHAVSDLNDMVDSGDIDPPVSSADVADQVDPGWLNDLADQHGVDPGDLMNHLDQRIGTGEVSGTGATPRGEAEQRAADQARGLVRPDEPSAAGDTLDELSGDNPDYSGDLTNAVTEESSYRLQDAGFGQTAGDFVDQPVYTQNPDGTKDLLFGDAISSDPEGEESVGQVSTAVKVGRDANGNPAAYVQDTQTVEGDVPPDAVNAHRSAITDTLTNDGWNLVDSPDKIQAAESKATDKGQSAGSADIAGK